MKRGTIIWLVVVLCCIFLGVWQRRNLSIFWREYRALWRDYDYYEYCLVPRRPLIPKSIARNDPEAAAVADMALRYYEEDEHILALANNLLKFPDNEFFLSSCVTMILRSNELDQEVGIRLAEKLIDFDKDNSIYHYLRAASMIANDQDGDITSVLDEINIAATCPNFYFPYVKYSQRTIAAAEKASLHTALMRMLSSACSYLYADTPRVRLISEFLLRYAHRVFTDGEIEKGLLIDDAINSIGKSQLDAGYNEARLIMNSKDIYSSRFGHWPNPEALELQRVDITEQRARQNRLQLCPYVLPWIKSKEDSSSHGGPGVSDELIIAVPVAVHNGRVLFVIFGVWLALVIICMFRGWSGNQRTGFGALLLFAAASLCYFYVINRLFFDELNQICHCCFSHADIMRPRPLALDGAVGLPPMYLFLLLICPVLAALLLWAASRPCKMSFWWRMLLKLIFAIIASAIAATLFGVIVYLDEKWIHEEWIGLSEFLQVFVWVFIFALAAVLFASRLYRLRFVRVILAAMPLGVLTILISPYAYISQIPFILFVVICTLIVLNKPSDSIPFMKALRGVFGSQLESAAIRSRAVKLLAPFIVIHWLLLVASVPICTQYIEQSYSAIQYSYPKSNLAPADETSYKRVLARFDSNDFTWEKFPGLIALIMPQDLPSVLNTTKNMSFASSYPFRSLKSPAERSDANSLSEEYHHKKIKLKDEDIITVMQGCGRDVVNILADSMDNPEQDFALVSRAKLGDVHVKTKLEQLLASRLQSGQPPEPNERRNYWDRPAKTIDIICALACISEPNEAGARFLDYVARCDVSQLTEDDEFFRGIPLLPTAQAREVIKTYLAKAQEWQPPERVMCDGEIYREDVSRTLWPLREVVVTYDDRDISEAVLKIMLRSEDEDIIKDWDEPWEIPQDFDMQSAELLRQGLASKNDQLRAWCVWQLRKTGYQFSEEEMSRLLADKSWKVRANAAAAVGTKTAGRAAEDQNPFVRWVASFIASE